LIILPCMKCCKTSVIAKTGDPCIYCYVQQTLEEASRDTDTALEAVISLSEAKISELERHMEETDERQILSLALLKEAEPFLSVEMGMPGYRELNALRLRIADHMKECSE
jgi:hypothetical protein